MVSTVERINRFEISIRTRFLFGVNSQPLELIEQIEPFEQTFNLTNLSNLQNLTNPFKNL